MMHTNHHQDAPELLARVESVGDQLLQLIEDVQTMLHDNMDNAIRFDDAQEHARIFDAESDQWLALARTDLKVGMMKLARVIAQPTGF